MDLRGWEYAMVWSSNLLLVQNLLLAVLFVYDWKIIRSTPVRWIAICYWILLLLAFLDWLFVVYFFTEDFPFLRSHLLPFLRKMKITHLTFLYPFTYLSRFILIGLFFKNLNQNDLQKRALHVAIIALVIFEIVQIVFNHSYRQYDSMSSFVKNVFFIYGSGMLLWKLFLSDSRISLYRNPYFWITLFLLLASLVDIFLEFIFQKLNQTDLDSFYKFYMVRNTNQFLGLLLVLYSSRYFKFLRFLPQKF